MGVGVGGWAEMALGSRMGWGPVWAGHPVEEKRLRTECHLEPPKVEAGEEEGAIMFIHSGTVVTQGDADSRLTGGEPGPLPAGE